MGRNSSVGSAWARCHSVAGSILLWGHFPVEGIFPLELTWLQTPFPQNSFGWEYKPRSSLCIHAFHRTDSKESWRSCPRRSPDVHVLDGWMPATKTHPARTITNVTTLMVGLKNGHPKGYSWGTQKKKKKKKKKRKTSLFALGLALLAHSAELPPLRIWNTMAPSKPYNFKLSICPISHLRSRCSTEHRPKESKAKVDKLSSKGKQSKGGFHLI